MSEFDIPESGFFEFETKPKDFRYADSRRAGVATFSRLFPSMEDEQSSLVRFITFGLKRVETTYRTAVLADELTLSREASGRTEVRLLVTEDGYPCQFIIQQFDTTKDAYNKIGVSLQTEDIDRLLVAILTHRHFRRCRFAQKETAETILLDELLARLEPVALQRALDAYETKYGHLESAVSEKK